MLTSFALIFIVGLALGWISKKLSLPALIGMLLGGMLLGPYALSWLDESVLVIAGDLRQIALVIILTRAGLMLNLDDLKKVGRPAILLCFVPACCEILGVVILAPMLFSIKPLEAALLGAVVAAVSPAVIVPRMIRLMEEGYGEKNGIAQMILAGASVDDIFVIVLFTSLLALVRGESVSLLQFAKIPISILSGIIVGVLLGYGFILIFQKVHMRDTEKVLILLSGSFLLIGMENWLEGVFPFSGLIAIMSMAMLLHQKNEVLGERISVKYNQLWVAAEVILFVLVGANVNIQYALQEGINALLLVICALFIRMAGVFLCLLGTKLSKKERLFCMIAYTPKATVQAAIGGIPLSLGLECGPLVLTVAVISIIFTAPVGAFAIDHLYKKLL